jgi:hypothetical protein
VQKWTTKAGSQRLSLHLRSPAAAQAATAAEAAAAAAEPAAAAKAAAALAALAAEQQVVPTAWREYVVQQVSCVSCSVITFIINLPIRAIATMPAGKLCGLQRLSMTACVAAGMVLVQAGLYMQVAVC